MTDSKTVNDRIEALQDSGEFYVVRGLEDTGKWVPYIGWFWREVNFDEARLHFGVIPGPRGFIGFMEKNKWGHDVVVATEAQTTEIKVLLEKAVEAPSNETLQAVFDAIQAVGER